MVNCIPFLVATFDLIALTKDVCCTYIDQDDAREFAAAHSPPVAGTGSAYYPSAPSLLLVLLIC
jgi:hypothetical protein